MAEQVVTQPANKSILTNLLQEFSPNRLLSSLVAGVVSGVLAVVVAISLAALIFSGNLSGYVSAGIGLALFTVVTMATMVAMFSSFRGAVASTQDGPAAILALVATAIAAEMPASASAQEIFLTVVAAIALTTLLTGAFFLVLGSFKLGSLIRFIPYPVIGGFLAGTGWLLVQGSVGVMADIPLTLAQLSTLIQGEVLIRWLPGLVFAILLLVILQRFSHFLVMPGLIIGAGGLFYLILWLSGTSLVEVTTQGWLMGPFPAGGLWQPLSLSDLNQIQWPVIFGQIGSVATILLVSVIGLLLNASGIELVIEQDIDLNHELKIAGLTNLVAGLGTGIPGYMGLSTTTLGYKIGAKSRLVGLIVALVAGLILFLGASVLSFAPKVVLGGLLMFLGLNFLIEWIYRAWFRLPKSDYFVVILILVAIATVGFLEGVAVGIVAAVILFAVNYSRTQAIKHALSGADYQSNHERSFYHEELLQGKRAEIYILLLQGYIFFGTANNLLEHIKQRIQDSTLSLIQYLVLDFRLVTGLDSSAILSFLKLKQLVQSHNLILVFTDIDARLQYQLEDAGCLDESDPLNWAFPDLDHGLEWCEDQMLAVDDDSAIVHAPPLTAQLTHLFLNDDDIPHLLQYFDHVQTPANHYLFRQGDPSDAIYFLEKGQVTVLLEQPNGQAVRLKTMGSGTVVGEMALYTGEPRSASVITDWASRFYRLSKTALGQMQLRDPRLAAEFHQFMGGLLAGRLAHANKEVQILLGQRKKEVKTLTVPATGPLEQVAKVRFIVQPANKEIVVIHKSELMIGRASTDGAIMPEIDLEPYHGRLAGVSREHCRLTCDSDGNWFIEDLGSANGTLVNDLKLAPNQILPLNRGCKIHCGQIWLQFEGEVVEEEKETIVEPSI